LTPVTLRPPRHPVGATRATLSGDLEAAPATTRRGHDKLIGMHRTRVAARVVSVATALVPVVVAVVAAVIVAGLAGVAVVSGVGAGQPTTALMVEGGNRGW
jgi:hypothetical protein